jgi:N-acetylmuramoyl-L-alanine amidase
VTARRRLAVLLLVCVLGGCTSSPGTGPIGAARAGSPGGPGSPTATPGPEPAVGATPTPGPPTARPSPSRRPRTIAGAVVLVDPGHNGANAAHPEVIDALVDAYTKMKPCDTTGTRTDAGYPEHAFNYDVATRLATLLRAAGATVVMTRYTDTGVGPCLTERAAIGNRAGATVAISIHADYAPPGAHGFHVLEPARISGAPSTAIVGPSHRLAVAVRDRLRPVQSPANYIGTDGINTRSDMGGLNLSRVPKVMVECGNMHNPVDGARLADPAYRQRLAVALAAALTNFVSRL